MTQNPFLALLTATGLLLTPLALPQIALAQQLLNVSPDVGSTNVPSDTSISGQFDTSGGSVDPSSVRILVNGQDVTSRSTITRNFFTYRPDQPFPPGVVRTEVQYRNSNGEVRTNTWTFTTGQSQPSIQITSVTHNAVGNPLRTGATFSVTINGTPGAQASVLLIEDSQTVREFAARETSPGVYVANLSVEQGDRVNEGIVVGRLRRQNQTTYAAAAQPVSINTSGAIGGSSTGGSPEPGNTTSTQALQPRFTAPRDGDRVGKNGFTLTGRTRPYATVQVQVVSGASVLGLNVGGQTILDQQVTADSRGRFQVDVPAPSIALPNLQYKVRATARAGSEASPQTEITLRE
jgi:hypothetical protein